MRLLQFMKCCLIACASVGLISCGNAGLSLTRQEQQKLMTVNTAIGDLEAAIVQAFASSAKASEGRVQRMARQLVASKCQQRLQKPRKDFTSSWNASELVQSESCPLYLSRQWAYDATARSWSVQQDLVVRNSAFAGFSGVKTIGLVGNMAVTHPQENQTAILGSFDYTQFEVVEPGAASVKIQTDQLYTIESGHGVIALNMAFSRQSFSAKIEWNLDAAGKNSVQYFINDVHVDPSDFADMFSSFGLDEIMAKSLQMRYL